MSLYETHTSQEDQSMNSPSVTSDVLSQTVPVGEDGLPLNPDASTVVDPVVDPAPEVQTTVGEGSPSESETTAVGEDGLPLEPSPDTGEVPASPTPDPASPVSETPTTLDSIIRGTEAGETISGTDNPDLILALAGDDIINALADADTVFAGEGDDQVNGDADADLLFGDEGNDLIKGGTENDVLLGGVGNDTIDGGAGVDLLVGGEGDDRLIWNNGDGSDYLIGGAGTDTIEINGAPTDGNVFSLSAEQGQTLFERTNLKEFTKTVDSAEQYVVNGGTGNDFFTTFDLSSAGIEQVTFTAGAGDDSLNGSTSTTSLIANGDSGRDALVGGSAADQLDGGKGSDWLAGGAGANQLTGNEGEDGFLLQQPTTAGEFDTITDFNPVEDTLYVSSSLFSDLEATIALPLSGSQFRVGESATEAGAQFIYNDQTGGLFYDSDGVNGADQVQVAALTAGLGVSSSDFFVV